MHKIIIIIGASGHGKVLADIAQKMNQWEEIYFLDDNGSVKEIIGFNVLGKVAEAFKYRETADFIVGIGDNSIRQKIQEELFENNFSIATLIHPNATIGMDVSIGVGTVIMAGVVINSSTKIGNGCIVNTSSSIDHDNLLADYVHISPGVRTGGTVEIGKGSWVGIGSTIINNIGIVEKSIVGAGSLVTIDLLQSATYFGVPARKKDRKR